MKAEKTLRRRARKAQAAARETRKAKPAARAIAKQAPVAGERRRLADSRDIAELRRRLRALEIQIGRLLEVAGEDPTLGDDAT